MNWKELGRKVVKIGAPLLGTALGGPGGGALGALVASAFGVDTDDPKELMKALERDPQALVKLKELEFRHKERLEEIALERVKIEVEKELTQIRQVNETMRAEAKSEHWPQYSWRPFNGFMYAMAVVCIYFALPLAGKPIPSVPEWVWLGWGAILGVTTWDRGKQKRAMAGDKSDGVLTGAIKAIKE